MSESEEETQIFLSFAQDGLELAREVQAGLEGHGIPAFLANSSIADGENIVAQLDEALRRALVLIPIITPGYLTSTWTGLERSAFLFLQAPDSVRTVMPIVVGDIRDLPPLLLPTKYERLTEGWRMSDAIDSMLPRLRKILNTSPAKEYAAFLGRYGVHEHVVVPSGSGATLYANLGRGAAGYFAQHVQRNYRVGLSCASTIYNMVRAIDPFSMKISAFPISFNLVPEMTSVMSSYATLIELWYRNPECTPYAIPNIPAASDNGYADAPSDVQELLRQVRDLNMAFYSCGSFGPGSSFDVAHRYINDHIDVSFSPSGLEESGACGEINWHPYSVDGTLMENRVSRVFGLLDLQTLRDLSRRPGRHMVLVAGGEQKVGPILGALRGGFLNRLVTDEQTLTAAIAMDRD